MFEKEGKERGHCARSGENNIRGGLYEGREGMLATMRAKFADGVTSSHQGHHHWIELTGEETARSHWSLQDDLYDAQRGGEFVGRAHYDNEYVKIDGRWYFAKMSLTYLRGEANIKKRYEDCANAYQVFMM
ncbi:nuclear transport factor 2 family protein [Eggerthella lenta]|uniref:nuclear transport factor 2 family protein n=1 Tax=Eggerthella lenta TaxID=84112 RepID=UPI003F6890E4